MKAPKNSLVIEPLAVSIVQNVGADNLTLCKASSVSKGEQVTPKSTQYLFPHCFFGPVIDLRKDTHGKRLMNN